MKISRRTLMQRAVMVSGAALPSRSPAQTPAQSAAPADLLLTSRDQVRRNAETLAKADLPMATEPAFSFKA